MILVDSNVPMYVVGGPHPCKTDALVRLQELIGRGARLVSDVEVLQEILHRYQAIARREMIQPAFDALLSLVDEVFPVELGDVQRAKEIVHGSKRLSARDALHLAVMERRGIREILSYDRGFDGHPGIRRLGDGPRGGA